MKRSDAETFFPDIEGEERQAADEWLDEYLRLVMAIYREHSEHEQLSTAQPLTVPEVLERSVRLESESPPITNDEEILRIHQSIDPETG